MIKLFIVMCVISLMSIPEIGWAEMPQGYLLVKGWNKADEIKFLKSTSQNKGISAALNKNKNEVALVFAEDFFKKGEIESYTILIDFEEKTREGFKKLNLNAPFSYEGWKSFDANPTKPRVIKVGPVVNYDRIIIRVLLGDEQISQNSFINDNK